MRSFRTLRIVLVAAVLLVQAPAFSRNDPEAPGLTPEERRRIIQAQEERWEYSDEAGRRLAPARPSRSAGASAGARAARESALVVQVREIEGAQELDIALENLRLSVPAGAFPAATRVRIEARVLDEPGDFVFAAPDMRIVENGVPALLESTGMFRLSFSDENGRALEPARPLIASMPVSGDAAGARVYQYKNEQWFERAASAIESGARNSELPVRLAQYAPGNATQPNNPVNPTPVVGECEGCSTSESFHFPQIYRRIDASGWWNFDVPKPEFTCVSVRIEGGAENAVVSAAGVEFQGVSHASSADGGMYQLNTLRSRRIKIFATIGPENERIKVGALPTLVSPDHIAHTSDPRSNCPLVGALELKPHPAGLLQERAEFLRIIEWPLN